MELFVIRHAQSANNALWAQNRTDRGRFPDPELTEIGERQAQQLANYLGTKNDGSHSPVKGNRYGLTHLYSSLMVRAIVTGTHVARALELPISSWEIVHEWGGIFKVDADTGERIGIEGPNRAYFEKRFPQFNLPSELGSVGWWNRPYEPPEASLQRADTFLNELIERHGDSDDKVAVFTHAGFTHAFMRAVTQFQRLNELPVGEFQVGFFKSNTGITRLRFNDNHIRVMGFNNISFLPDDLIT